MEVAGQTKGQAPTMLLMSALLLLDWIQILNLFTYIGHFDGNVLLKFM